MQNDQFFNQLIKQDWTENNLQVLKYCKELADNAVQAHSNVSDYPFLATPHLPVFKGVSRWVVLDYFLGAAVKNDLFVGITARWINFEGAPILELRGKYTSLTACHVLSRDEKPKDSKNGYRKNNQAKNQKNLELFTEFEAPVSEDDLLHIILLHGGSDDNFAYLRIYLEDSDIPTLTENIMLMPSLEMAPDAEFVLNPSVALKGKTPVAEPETVVKTKNDDSQS
jgi:hypothetical protein